MSLKGEGKRTELIMKVIIDEVMDSQKRVGEEEDDS